MNRREEFHVTIAHDADMTPIEWWKYCAKLKVKPLWIELNTFDHQLLCATATDPRPRITGAYEIIRFKHEVECPRKIDVTTFLDKDKQFISGHVPGAVYYECHVKLNGPFRPDLPMASRNLYRKDRWYMSHRSTMPFDGEAFARAVLENVSQSKIPASAVAGWEYEAVLEDTNPSLDDKWIERAHRTYEMLNRATSRIVVPR